MSSDGRTRSWRRRRWRRHGDSLAAHVFQNLRRVAREEVMALREKGDSYGWEQKEEEDQRVRQRWRDGLEVEVFRPKGCSQIFIFRTS